MTAPRVERFAKADGAVGLGAPQTERIRDIAAKLRKGGGKAIAASPDVTDEASIIAI